MVLGEKTFSIMIMLTERQASEFLWSRFINVYGLSGKNIPKDLHCEHLNRLCKTAVKGLGVNEIKECITRVAKALGTVSPVLKKFDDDNMVSGPSSVHHSIADGVHCTVNIMISFP